MARRSNGTGRRRKAPLPLPGAAAVVVCKLPVFALVLSVLISAAGARELVDDAQHAYQAGDYGQAARLLEAASKLDPSSRILFNLARALDKAGEVEKAITAYETYLDRPDAELPALKRARAALAVLYRSRPATPVAPPPVVAVTPTPVVEPAPVPTPTPTPTPVVPVAPVTPKDEPVVVAPIVPPAPSARPLRIASFIGLGVAGAAAGTGLAFGAWANGTATQARASIDPTSKPSLVAAAQGRALATDVMLFAAAGVALTSAVLFFIDWLVTP